jgi:hypothetical protein
MVMMVIVTMPVFVLYAVDLVVLGLMMRRDRLANQGGFGDKKQGRFRQRNDLLQHRF